MQKRSLAVPWVRAVLFPCLIVFLLAFLLIALGCGGGGKEPAGETGGAKEEVEAREETAKEIAEEESTPGAREETEGGEAAEATGFSLDEVKGGSEAVMILKDIRFGDHAGYERVVVEFTGPEGNPGGGTPRFRARYLEPPYVDAEGNTVAIEGTHLIELYFCGNTADLSVPAGYKVVYEGPETFEPGLAVIRQAKLVPAYELNGMILLIGLGERAPFRVEENLGPPRIVIDVKK